MKADDLDLYFDYLEHFAQLPDYRKLYLVYPEDYIDLLRELRDLRIENQRLKSFEFKWQSELSRSLAAEDKLKWLQSYCRREGIVIPNFTF